MRFEISAPAKTVLADMPAAVSPDGRSVAFVARGDDGQNRLWIRSIDSLERMRERLAEGASRAQYAPPAVRGEPGHLLYVRDATLMAQPLDSTRFQLVGDAFPVTEQIGAVFGGAAAFFSVSSSGALAYRTGGSTSGLQLTWFDRKGTSLASIGQTGVYTDVALSRGGNPWF